MATALKSLIGKEASPVEVTRFPTMFEEMERWAEEMFPRGWLRPLRFEGRGVGEWYPRIDVIDREDALLVRAAMPGFSKNDIEISVSDKLLTIHGKAKHEEEVEKGEYYRCEISRGDMVRTISLPVAVDDSKAKAEYKDGLVELTLPKVEKAKTHRIEIH